MARNGEGRPNKKNHKLGSALGCYTNPKNRCYDPEFDKEIRELTPSRFVKSSVKK